MEHIGKILIVDDEVGVTSALTRILRRKRWQVVAAFSAEEALEVLKKESDFSVIVSDYRMPGDSGVGFLARSREFCPEASRVLLTGYADIHAAVEAINHGAVFKFLVKPWKEEDLLAALELARAQFELVSGHRLLTAALAEKNEQLGRLNGSLEERVRARTAEADSLNQELQASLMGAIRVMGAAGERKDQGPGGHGRRVASLAGQLSRRLRLDAAAAFRAQAAGYLHAIGGAETPEGLAEAARLIEMVPHMEGVAALVRKLADAASPVEPAELEVLRVAVGFERALNSAAALKTTEPVKALESMESPQATFSPAVVGELRRHLEETNQLRSDLYELQMGSRQLRDGMVLSRGLLSRKGLLLLARGTRLSLEHIKGMWSRTKEEQPADEVYVLRESLKAA